MVNLTADSAIMVKAPAKINLFLEINGLLDNGYHNISSIATPISLYDNLSFQLIHEGIDFKCTSSDTSLQENNIVIQAARLLKEKYHVDKGIEIKLVKNIPVGAGLGGGSSDAASTLSTLNILWDLSLSKRDLMKIAATLGADVSLFLENGPVHMRGAGEKITKVNSQINKMFFIIISPSFSISTKKVYENMRIPSKIEMRSPAAMIEGLKSGRFDMVANNIFNRLQETAFRIEPRLKDIHEEICSAFNKDFFMSGSGSSLFLCCDSENEAVHVAEKIDSYNEISVCTASMISSIGSNDVNIKQKAH